MKNTINNAQSGIQHSQIHPGLDQLGRALRDVRVSVMDRCNYRCGYCMPQTRFPRDHAFLSAAQRMDTPEISTLITALLNLGMQKLRITGGEPLLRKDLPEIIGMARAASAACARPLEIALTTNASLLAAQAQRLFAAGLDRLTISLDSLDPQRFRALSGDRGELAAVLLGVAAAERAGFGAIKFNCVVQKGVNESDVLGLCERFRNTPHVPRFIEYMDVGTCNGWQPEQVVASADLIARIHAQYPLEQIVRPAMGEVATRYRYLDGAGEIGFISSISTPFCRSCTRARVTADGKLFTCLFNSSGHDLLALLRTHDAVLLVQAIQAIWAARTDRYSELRAARLANGTPLAPDKKAEMYHLGG
jgi:GTP 3',8-cyclase